MKYMELAGQVAEYSNCERRKVGAVIVNDDGVLAVGNNTCGTEKCQRTNMLSGERLDLCEGMHAERMAIIYCIANTIPTEGAELYCTTKPCDTCRKIIEQAGIKQVHYRDDYPSTEGRETNT